MNSLGVDLKAVTTSRDETGGIIQELHDDSERQNEMEIRYNMQLDSWRDILVLRLNERLTNDVSKERLKTYARTRFNPFRSINEEISDLYTEDPTREFEGTNQDVMQEIYERVDVDTLMELVNIFLNAVNDVILYVKRLDDNTIDIDFLPPHVVTVLCDSNDPTIPVAVYIKRRWNAAEDYTQENQYWVVWTKDLHYILTGEGETLPIEGNDGMLNPWGKLPFVFIHRKRPIDGFWNSKAGTNLFEFTISFGIRDAMNEFTKFWSGFKQIAAFGDHVNVPAGMLLSPDTAMAIEGDGVQVMVMDFQIQLEQLAKDMEFQKASISQEYGIDMGNYRHSEKESGRAIYIRNTKLQKIRTKQEKVLRTAEQQLFELIKWINAIINGANPESDETEMNLNYAEMKAYIEPKDELDIQAREIELNLADIVEVYMKRDPDFKGDYEEAKQKLIKIHISNNEFRQIPDASITDELNRDEENIPEKEKDDIEKLKSPKKNV